MCFKFSYLHLIFEHFNPLAVEYIYLATSAKCAWPINWPTEVKTIDFINKMKLMKLQYFCIFMYIWWLLKFLVVVFFKSLPNCAAMPELSKWSISKAWQVLWAKNPQSFNNTAASSHYCTLWDEHRHWALIWTICLCGKLIKPSLGHWYSEVLSNPQPSWGLASTLTSDYRQSIVCNGRPHLQLHRQVFVCEKLTKPCHYARSFQLISQQSLANTINKNSEF